MDIDKLDKQVRELMAFKADAEPMLREWQQYKAKQVIGAGERGPLTEQEHAKHATMVLGHARKIAEILATPPKKK